MKSTGIVRNIDELGRIVVPKEMRDKLHINNSDPVEFFTEGDKIIITKYHASCIFCGSEHDTVDFKGKMICKTCLSELNAPLS